MVELVIKLSEENYTEICKCAYPNDSLVGELVYQVRNNKTLTKGHGKLVDVESIPQEDRKICVKSLCRPGTIACIGSINLYDYIKALPTVVEE